MIDWTKSMRQSFEFYIVDPLTWKDAYPVNSILSCNINRDSNKTTLGSGIFNCTENIGECYIRVYLIAIQDGITYKVPIGTRLVQTPSVGFDGKQRKISLDGYTPLIELKGTLPPIGYSLLKGERIMSAAYRLCREHLRPPVVLSKNSDKLEYDFISNLDDTWLSFISDLVYNAEYKLWLDELDRILFKPIQDIASLQPVWTYNDDNSSILYPEIEDERDLYNIPNVVEVVYSSGTSQMFSRVVNNDKNSPVSTVNRGREVVHRITDPNINGEPTQQYLDDYAKRSLRNLSCLEHKITYTHGYCPVRIDDCVLLNYKRAGLVNVKAQVISQAIQCDTGCTVEETAVYTTQLWR